MILFKDYSTGKKSLTVTGLIITFLLSVASIIINFYLMVNGKPSHSDITFSCIGFFSVFGGLYWNKRFRASASGIELGGDDVS